uniref:Uncharacterized protein n=1 Tax=Sinocyclocheilus rhinocerous TaxID=307959 RepID=A0A673FM21_9TELE
MCPDHKDLSHPHTFLLSGENDLFLASDIPVLQGAPIPSAHKTHGISLVSRSPAAHPAAFHVQQDIKQESLLWMRGAHATGSPLLRKACVPPLAPCQTVNDEHMLESTIGEHNHKGETKGVNPGKQAKIRNRENRQGKTRLG